MKFLKNPIQLRPRKLQFTQDDLNVVCVINSEKNTARVPNLAISLSFIFSSSVLFTMSRLWSTFIAQIRILTKFRTPPNSKIFGSSLEVGTSAWTHKEHFYLDLLF